MAWAAKIFPGTTPLCLGWLLLFWTVPSVTATTFVVDLYGPKGYSPSCSSSDTHIFAASTSDNSCFGATTVAPSSYPVSFMLVPTGGSMNEVELRIFGGSSCDGNWVSLGNSFANDASGLCQTPNGFSLGGYSYRIAWTVKTTITLLPPATIGAIVGK